MKEITRDNCRLLLAAFLEEHELIVRDVARVIGCSEASMARVLAAKTKPSDEMLKQVGVMFGIGFERHKTLSESEKEKIFESLGVVTSGAFGFVSIGTIVSSLGSVAGVSAAGITSATYPATASQLAMVPAEDFPTSLI